MKVINFTTPAAQERLTPAGLWKAQQWFEKQPDGDWFYLYETDGQQYFIEENETAGYTILLPNEH